MSVVIPNGYFSEVAVELAAGFGLSFLQRLRRIAMSFLNRLMVMLALCTVLLCCIAMGFLNRLIAVLATCAALAAGVAASAVLHRGNKLLRLTSKIPAGFVQVSQLNSSVYELHSPPGEPSMDVLFFHGFQHGDYKDARLSTWKCRDGSSIWPQTWLVEKFPAARILSVSYDASVIDSCEGGTMDMHLISENLTSDLLTANVGQEPCRPVVLVGHSFGGLVIKDICVYASRTTGLLKRNSEKSFQLTAFLENVKGIFFYSTPHQGVSYHIAEHFVTQRPLLEYVKTLSTPKARVNFDFDNLCGQDGQYKMWQIAGVGESLPTKLGSFSNVVVEEASARYGTSFNIVERADHISVCRPLGKTCRSFLTLTKFLEDVAADSKAIVDGLPDYPTALEKRVFEVQQKLATTPVLGIVGMGGIGKTTIAKELFNKISRQFEYTCFVDNVKGMKVHELKDWVRKHFLRNGTRVDENSLRWSDLQTKKILIAADDVDRESQVRNLPRLDEFGSGSRLIFTTRDKGVFNTVRYCAIYEVDVLKFYEAKQLFCQHAFQQKQIPDDLIIMNCHLKENVKKVVEKCGGLPLTLEVMGCYLRDHKTNPRVWKQTLDKLGRAQSVDGLRDDRVWSSLRVSYDALSPEEQGMFIEAGTYFFEEPVEIALAAWSTAFGDSESRWANLLRTSMVKEVHKTEWDDTWRKQIKYKEVWVHEQLRDLAYHLSKGAIISTPLGKRHRALDLLNANAVQAQTSILRLWNGDPVENPKLQFELLDKLEKLKYLELLLIFPEGPSNTLSRKLCLLKCTYHRFSRYRPLLPISLEDMKYLAVLQLACWAMPEESLAPLGKLRNLSILSLDSIRGPSRLPDNFGHLYQLKRLELTDIGLTALPHSFGNLSALEHLLLSWMPELVELPKSFGNLSSLATLLILNCGKLESLPESFRHLSLLTELRIVQCPSLSCQEPTEVRQFGLHENLSSLTSLSLRACSSLERLPTSFERLSSLRKLELIACTQLKTLPENIGQFKALTSLRIIDAENLEALPDSFGNLPALRNLLLNGCRLLGRLPASFGNLSALQTLELSECEALHRFPDNFGQLMALEQLTIQGALELEALPDDFRNLVSLTSLSLSHCPSLVRLPESFGLLSALQELELISCKRLQRLPDNFNQLLALKALHIVEADHREELPDRLGNLSSLEGMLISANTLQRFRASIGQLQALKKLTIIGDMGSSLPEELGNLGSLEILRIQNCRNVETLPESLGSMSSLKIMILDECSELKSLPDGLGRNLSRGGDRSSETRRSAGGHSCKRASTEKFGLHVYWCPFLSDSVLEGIGWIKSHENYFVRDNDRILDWCEGTWYQRKCPGETWRPVNT